MDFLPNKSTPKRASRGVDRTREAVLPGPGCIDAKVGERVSGSSPLEERASRERVVDRPRRPRRPGADARGHERERRVEPTRHAVTAHEGALRHAEEEAAAGRDDDLLPAAQGTQGVPLRLAKAPFSRSAKD